MPLHKKDEIVTSKLTLPLIKKDDGQNCKFTLPSLKMDEMRTSKLITKPTQKVANSSSNLVFPVNKVEKT